MSQFAKSPGDATFHIAQALLPGGWTKDVRLTVSAGVITGVTAGVAALAGDERHEIALPGLPNLHSHAFQRGMAGFAEVTGDSADSFWTWREVMYRFLARLSPEDMRAIAAMAYVEMLESGFTRVGEFHYLHHDPQGAPYSDCAEMAGAVAQAAQETGIALTLLPVFYAHAGFGGQAPGAGQRRFIHTLDGFARMREAASRLLAGQPDAVLGVAPHSLRAVTPGELGELVRQAPGGPVHIHIAEQTREVDDCLAWSGQRPVAWLLDHADVDARWCLVHATHMTVAETRALAATGAVAGLCPITEANLGDGLFPALEFMAAGGRWGVGSDSNVLIDAAEELRWLEYGQRLVQRRRNLHAQKPGAHTGDALLGSALAGGAQALGGQAALAAGAPADFVT
ncbi:formimidoylglutamate deiminase, partial [Novosphingobium rosa]|uniref:formimidoylglutamate deiminase n=1 Tax=Novosphingobium rosa TaxID=76978 RepID=UPI000830D561